MLGLVCAVPAQAARHRLGLRHVTVDLPGPPSKILSADLDGDGRRDLVVVLAYTEVREIGEDRIENLVQIATVIPAIFDRREVRAYLARDAGYEPLARSLELPVSVLHMEPGPPGLPIVALTDEGLSELRLEAQEGGPQLVLNPCIQERPVLAGSDSFQPALTLVQDLDGDGIKDVLLPAADGPAVYLGTPTGLALQPASRLELPGDLSVASAQANRWYPMPRVRFVNGDALPDLVVRESSSAIPRQHVLLGLGAGRFGPLRSKPLDCHDKGTDLRLAEVPSDLAPWPQDLVELLDLDGDGRAEAVLLQSEERGEGMRAEMKDAKRPRQQLRLHRLRQDLTIEPKPYFQTVVEGYFGDEGDEGPLSTPQFEDLDGDGRRDIVTLTLDFSMLQVMRVLVTKKFGLSFDFHVWRQLENGSFIKVEGLDLSEKLRFDLDNLSIGRFAQFAGDFDGDGRHDFVHLGRGESVTLHRGQPGCQYARNPDLTIEVEEQPASLDLVRVEDIDGDGRSDIRIVRPLPVADQDVTPPVRVDLYLSGEAP